MFNELFDKLFENSISRESILDLVFVSPLTMGDTVSEFDQLDQSLVAIP